MARNIFLAITASLFIGCAGATAPKTMLALNQDGYLSINRVAPQVSAPAALYGFVPQTSEKQDKWISIDSSAGKVCLMEGNAILATAQAEGKMKVKPGTYSLMHKQRSPLWYAGDSYFSRRGISIPAPGDKERYRRGALGDFALFIDRDTSLHSSPVWTDEVGGLRINDLEIRKIYYSLDVGSKIEIK